MTSNLGKRVFKHSFVLTTAILTCVGLQADHNDQHGDKTQNFIRKAAMGGQMEVEMGQLAEQKGQAQEVKSLGATLVRDHTQANQRLQQLASSKNITLENWGTDTTSTGHYQSKSTDQSSKSTDRASNGSASSSASTTSTDHADRGEHAKHQRELDKLRSQSGAEFDKQFVRMAIKDHKKDIAEFEKARTDLTDPEIKAFVDQTLPTLRNHLQMAQNAARAVGVDEASIAADREDESSSNATGAPASGAIGTRGSDRPSSPASNPATNPQNKERSSYNGNGRLNGATDADASGTIKHNAVEANVGDSSVSASADVNNSASSTTTIDTEKKHKVFQKDDGKVLGLSTDKNDGKFLGIIPDPKTKKEHKDKGVSADVNVNGAEASGSAATTESSSSSRSTDQSSSDQK